jgi:hypothetical protein
VKITAANIAAVLKTLGATGGQYLPAADLALGASEALDMSPDTNDGAAVWMATQTQESAYLRTTVEYGSGQDYSPYVGRTFEQVTWIGNYREFGDWAVREKLIATADLFVKSPKLLGEMQWAWLGGVWYFERRNLWRYANTGDMQTVSNAVNRGTVTNVGYPAGWDARLACYQAWCTQIARLPVLAVNGKLDEPTNRRLQQWVGVAMDGVLGAVTYSAVQKWLERPVDGSMSKADIIALQKEIGALPDGDWGPGTTKQLQRYLNANR